MSCLEFEEDLSALVDGELAAREATRVTAHLETCEACTKTLQEFREISRFIHGLEMPAAPLRITDAAMATVRSRIPNGEASWLSWLRQMLFEPFWPKASLEALGAGLAVVLIAFAYRAELGIPGHRMSPQAPASEFARSDRTDAESQASAVAALPPIIRFTAADELRSVVRPTPVLVAPIHNAPQQLAVTQGTRVEVIAKSQDGSWAWVATADGSPAYIAMSDLSDKT